MSVRINQKQSAARNDTHGRTIYKRRVSTTDAATRMNSQPAPRVSSTVAASAPTRPRRLLVCLDGVPHTIIKQARERGLFEMFREPTRLLSPFPTMTNVALSTMLCATPPLGYESLYFDRQAGQLAGGVGKYIGPRTESKKPSSYMDALDYQEPLPCEFLVYVAPERVCFADFQRFDARFSRTAPQKDFFAFLKATDGLLHIRGAAALQNALIELDQILRRTRARCGAETEIMLFSDHGMNTDESRRIKLRQHLERHGFMWTNRVGSQDVRSVAVPAFGLVGFAALYCANEEAANGISASLTTLEGVDFSVTRMGDAARITGERGVAHIRRRNDAGAISYAYEQISGDPLHLTNARRALDAAGDTDAAGFASADAWYRQTMHHIYPDALANLYGAIFDARVEHTADVLVSLHDGYYYGATVFSRMARRLFATHGNALAESSTAFLMSTHTAFPECVRACDAQPLLRG